MQNNKNLYNQEAEKFFHAGKKSEAEQNYLQAYENFDLAAQNYLLAYKNPIKDGRNKQDISLHYLRAAFNSLINLIKYQVEESDDINFPDFLRQVKTNQDKRVEFLKSFIRFEHYSKKCFRIERKFFGELYQFLLDKGFKDESEKIFFLKENVESEKRYNEMLFNRIEKRYLKSFIGYINFISNKIFYGFLNQYGFRIGIVISLSIISMSIFACLFSTLPCFKLNNCEAPGFLSALLGSALIFIGYDYDIVLADQWYGWGLIFLEGILGLITVAGIIAFIWRKIK